MKALPKPQVLTIGGFFREAGGCPIKEAADGASIQKLRSRTMPFFVERQWSFEPSPGKSHFPLRIGRGLRLSLLLLLSSLFVRAVAAVRAAGGGTDHAVTSIVTCDAAGDGAFDAALGIGCGRRNKQERAHRE
jgi:hypothetical protein